VTTVTPQSGYFFPARTPINPYRDGADEGAILMSPRVLARRLSTALALAFALSSLAAHAQPREAEDAYDGDEPRLLARLHAEPATDAQWRVGVELVPDPGWHLYGRDPGEVGLPPRIQWHLPGARFGELAWPEPIEFRDEPTGIVSYGYDHPVLLATTAELPSGAQMLAASVEALVCKHVCLPARFELAAPLDASAGSQASASVAQRAEGERRPAGWLSAIWLGWLGGLVLNLMPCVLPVLAIKVAALAGLADHSRRDQLRHAFAYATGILLSMLALAAVVVGLRAAGSSVGWGFQLQEPAFLVAICALLVAFALNLFGAYEIDVNTSRLGAIGASAPGATRSFFDGLLAVALATPCSAPFLGTAVGFAFASPAPLVAAIFFAIGLGLATPFLLAACSPAFARRIPRSGAWMTDLRAALGFALLLTVVWLLWILGRVSGADAIAPALLLLLAIAAAAWMLGLVQRRGRAVSGIAIGLVLSAIAAPGIVTLDLAPVRRAQPDAPAIPNARKFAAADVRAGVASGRPAFVYFTADWCMTCKVNEKRVLSEAPIARELERLDYDVYVGDWTRRDETIRSALAGLGKAGVPVYAVYAPGSPDRPRLLPELLTVDLLLSSLNDGVGARDASDR
jgi:thiol:disulfide interchange protein